MSIPAWSPRWESIAFQLKEYHADNHALSGTLIREIFSTAMQNTVAFADRLIPAHRFRNPDAVGRAFSLASFSIPRCL